jgi:hypothetical protein
VGTALTAYTRRVAWHLLPYLKHLDARLVRFRCEYDALIAKTVAMNQELPIVDWIAESRRMENCYGRE